MFAHFNVFKKKQDAQHEAGFTPLSRQKRVEKKSRRSGEKVRASTGTIELPSTAKEASELRRCGGQTYIKSPKGTEQYDPFEPPREPATPYAAARPPSARPRIDRNTTSVSCTIRNPFRSQSSESIDTIGQLSEWSTESVAPIGRTVPSYLPKWGVTPIIGSPHKASITTTLDPFLDAEDSSSEPDSPATPVVVTR
ncbi:hypothetical protein BD309DRAFT_392468 [Dichomitus squalens]|nr:hypothetical protein BD309DRAFT_392468 [Dichomitus squalens]